MSEERVVTVVTTQVQAKSTEALFNGDQNWSSGMCGCFDDCMSCLCVTFCCPFYACYMSSHLREYCCVPWCVGPIPMRQKIRMMRGIRGSICEDCLVFYFPCTSLCALCQMAREMKHAAWLWSNTALIIIFITNYSTVYQFKCNLCRN